MNGTAPPPPFTAAIDVSTTSRQGRDRYARLGGTSEVIRERWRPTQEVTDSRAAKDVIEYEERPAPNLLILVEKVVAARMASMADTLHQLSGLLTSDYDYDEDYLCPSRDAFDATWKLITKTASLCRTALPGADMGPLGDGGLSIQWGDQSRYVRLLMPPDPSRAYLYSKGPGVKAISPAEPSALAQQIAWLAQK